MNNIAATSKFYIRIPYDHPASWAELYHWCKENCQGEFRGNPKFGIVSGIVFEKEEDAIMFSLKWS